MQSRRYLLALFAVALFAAERLAGAAEGLQLPVEHVSRVDRLQHLGAGEAAAHVLHDGVVAPPLAVEGEAVLAVLMAGGEGRRFQRAL